MIKKRHTTSYYIILGMIKERHTSSYFFDGMTFFNHTFAWYD